MEMLNSRIEFFLNEAKSINNDVFINLQGYPYFFKLIDFDNLEFGTIRESSDVRSSLFLWDYTNFEEKGFDIKSGFPLFKPIVDGVEIATDNSGKLYEIKYSPRNSNKEHSIKVICETIDLLLKDIPLNNQPKDKDGNIILHSVNSLTDILSPEQIKLIYKFSDVGYTIDDYIHTLKTIIKNHDLSMHVVDSRPINSQVIRISSSETNMDFNVELALNKGEWISHLVEKINKMLGKQKQEIRFALVYQNSWKELYGLTILDKEIYVKLKSANLIKEAP